MRPAFFRSFYSSPETAPAAAGCVWELWESRAAIPRLQGEIDFLKIRTVMEEDIIAETRDLADKWQTMDTSEKRRVVESLLRRITIHKEVVDIDLANLPPLSEMMAKGPPLPGDGRAMGEGVRG